MRFSGVPGGALFGKITAQGTVLTLPHNWPLTNFATRHSSGPGLQSEPRDRRAGERAAQRQALDPSVREPVDVFGLQLIAQLLQVIKVLTPPEAIVHGLETDAFNEAPTHAVSPGRPLFVSGASLLGLRRGFVRSCGRHRVCMNLPAKINSRSCCHS